MTRRGRGGFEKGTGYCDGHLSLEIGGHLLRMNLSHSNLTTILWFDSPKADEEVTSGACS